MDRLKRFEYCGDDLFPYIEGVLREYYDKKMQDVLLDDKCLQVISTHKSHNAFSVWFREPVKSIICIFWHELEEDSEKRQCIINTIEEDSKQCIINAIGEYFDEDGDIGKKLEPFECCHNNVRPYIPRVLDRLFPEKRQVVQADIDNGSLQIISSHIKKENRYFTVKFNKPVESMIYTNWEKLKEKAEEKKIYGIAHEIGHCYARDGESRLLEKEANDWLKKWGNFEDIIEKAKDSAPKDEEKGYMVGHEWAMKNPEELSKYNCFLKLWNDLKRKEKDGLEKELIQKAKSDFVRTKSDKTDNEDIEKGIAYGIMKRVRELSKEKN